MPQGRSNTTAFMVMLPLFGLVACATPQQVVSQNEDNLAAAGFTVRPANTPDRQAMLNRLPPDRFVQRAHGDSVTYVYADPLVCGCLYIGGQQAYDRYQLHLQQQKLADQQLAAAQTYSDATWNWGVWGPWGPGYEFSPAPGW